MHTEVPSKVLSTALAVVKPALIKSAQGEMAQVLLAAADGHLTLSIAGRDMAITTRVPATVHADGSVAADHTDLARTAKGKAAAPIDIEVRDGGVVVTNGIATMLDAWPAADRPLPEHRVPAGAVEHPTVRFDADALGSVLAAASADATRPILTGVLWHTNPAGAGVFAATDSYRLHTVTGVTPPPLACIIPAAALAAVAAHHTGAVTATVYETGRGRGSVRLVDEAGTSWMVALIDGDYPHYQQLIPSSHPYTILFPRPAFVDAVRDLGKVANAKMQQPAISLSGCDAGLRLSVRVQGKVIGEKILPGVHPMLLPPVGFNPDFLRDLVTGLRSCSLELIDPLKPALLRDVDDAGRTHLRLIMPVRIEG